MLPIVEDEAAFDRMHGEPARWQPIAEALAARHGLAGPLTRIERGSAIVFAQDERVLKLSPPMHRDSFEREHDILARLGGRLPVPSPQIVAQGDIEGWPYLWMTRLRGEVLDDRWDALGPALRAQLARQAGELTRALHATAHDGLRHVHQPYEYPDWASFVAAMRARCVQHNADRGLAAPWLDELPGYLDSLDPKPDSRAKEPDSLDHEPQNRADELDSRAEQQALHTTPAPTAKHVLLHTELGPGHLLMEGEQLTGLIDFADAAVGPPEYDLAAVGIFVTRGDAAAFRAFLDGYGMPSEQRGADLVRRLMRHALLHRYGHLPFYLKMCPPDATTLAEAAAYWFGH